jgi:hypothetical protein
MPHTAAVFYSTVVAFQNSPGLAGKHFTRAKSHDPGQILKFVRQVMHIHTQVPVTLRPTIGPQVVADRIGQMQPFGPGPAYNSDIQSKLTLPDIHDCVGVAVRVGTHSASLNVKSARHINVQPLFVCFALFTLGVLAI